MSLPPLTAIRGRLFPLVLVAAAALLPAGCRENLTRPPAGRAEPPVLIYVTPSTVPQGTSTVVLRVVGEHFTDSSRVLLNGTERPTTFVSAEELRARIPAEDMLWPGSSHISVFTPPPGGGSSATTALFNVARVETNTDSAGPPTISRLLPSAAAVLGASFRLTIYGSRYTPRTVVRWNGEALPTDFIKDTKIVAYVPSRDIGAAGTAVITVATPQPGGGVSRAHPFAVVSSGGGHPSSWDITPVPVDDAPLYATVGPDGVGYVARPRSDSIMRIDLAAGSYAGSFHAGRRPGDIAFNAAGSLAYVASTADSSIVALATSGGAVTARFALGAAPVRVALLGDTLLYVTASDQTVRVLHAVTGALFATVPIGGRGEALAFAPGGARLWIAGDDGTLTELATATQTVTRTALLDGPLHDVAASADGTLLYVSDEIAGLAVVDAATLQVVTTLLAEGPYGVALTPDGEQLWVTHPAAGLTSVFDTAQRTLLGVVYTLGTPRHVRFNASGTTALITNEAGEVFVIR